MNELGRIPPEARRRLAWPLRLTFLGMLAERATRTFWPLWSIAFAVSAALMLGLQDHLPLEVVWGAGVVSILGALWALAHGVRRFRWPRPGEVADRLDRTLSGRPIAALADIQAVGADDAASAEVWRAHVRRMAERAGRARPVPPDLRVADRDPFALRYVALTALAVALLFGSFWRVGSVAEMGPLGGGAALAAGPSWEGWIEPPAYTAKPSLYLNDQPAGRLEIPQGSRITVRLYGEVGALTLAETVSGRAGDVPAAAEPEQSFEVTRPGALEVAGPGGRAWDVAVIADAPPSVRLDGPVERGASGEMRQPFAATDDYGVVAGQAEMVLDMDALDRRYGLALDPEPREAIVFDLPMTITGDRRDFSEVLIESVADHPWVGLPVRLMLSVEDAAGQTGATAPEIIELPGRRFFDTLAKAIVEQRRDLLWNRENGRRVAQILRAVSHRPEDVFDSETVYLRLRVALRRLELGNEYGLSDARRDEIAQALWDIAVLIEDGTLAGALERLREAQERLAEAIRNGANEEEIAELMQELREAMQDYIRQLAEQQQQDPGQQQAEGDQQQQTITGDQLEEMLQRLQELMEQGRMDEAQQLLEALRQMMENMQVTQGEGGQPSPGQQAMEGLADTLRQQQGLSDDTFSDLQRQFDQPPGQQPGQEPGQRGGEGEQGQQGDRPGMGREGDQTPGDGLGRLLADRQQALRDLLDRQARGLPAPGTAEGDAAREALDRAGRAMDGAEQALRDDDLAGALDEQAEAMEALREGLRNLGEALAQQQQGEGGQGDTLGRAEDPLQRDPLGRDLGANGRIGTDERLLQGDDVYRRARDLLDEIRRRSSDQTRPGIELDYLRRLLDRF